MIKARTLFQVAELLINKLMCGVIVVGLMSVSFVSWGIPIPNQGGHVTNAAFGSTVKADGKRFVQDGREIILNGINYFPAYSPAIYPDNWLDAKHYRPGMVEDDLSVMSALGINLVSVQWITRQALPDSQDCLNIRDFIDRAQAHSLLVNLFIGTGGFVPFENPAQIAVVPKVCALADRPALLAYDIAWEPRFGDEAQRLKLQSRWLKWLEVSYGKVATADAAFGGGHILPTNVELCGERPSVKAAAFRRFLDDVLSNNYREIRAAIRAVDDTHLIGVRSGYGGNGSAKPWMCAQAPVDLRAGVKHLDFVSPESYALPNDNRSALLNRGGFTSAYADVGKPIFWSEFGVNVDNSCPNCIERIQANYFRDMFDMIRRTRSNGGAGWWYVGVRPQGEKDKEKSDYGIIYDYIKNATARDSLGDTFRDGLLAVCTNQPSAYALVNTGKDGKDASSICPKGLRNLGSFSVGSGVASGVHFKDHANLAFCGVGDNAFLKVTHDDIAQADYSCPVGYKPTGSFKPSTTQTAGRFIATDALGKSIISGWLTLCTRTEGVMLKRVGDAMTGRTMSCPPGTVSVGSFKPEALPIFRPVAQQFKGALDGLSASQRIYTSWITVDRDTAAGDWKMYETGSKAYAQKSLGGALVGVKTACAGTTSREVKFCVGNVPYNGSCPAKCLNAEWNTVQIRDINGVWQTVADRGSVIVAANSTIQARLSVGNTGESVWLTSASASGTKGSVRFGCNENIGNIACRHEVSTDTLSLADADSGNFEISKGISKKSKVVFQMVSEGVAWFGGQMGVVLLPQ